MLVDLSIREIEVIRALIAQDRNCGSVPWDNRAEAEESKVTLVLKLFAALEDCESPSEMAH
jgi:hypothetical protein